MKTVFLNAGTAKHDWVVVDATDKTLGRLATKIAMVLRGKHKPEYTPNADTGDYVVVINAEKVRVTGNKLDGKIYWRHTEYAGGIKSQTLREMLDKHPERAIVSQRLVKKKDGKRCAAIEIMINTPYIADLILKRRIDEVKEAMSQSSDKGMLTFDNCLYNLYKEGQIELEEALSNADSRTNLEAKINFGT